MRKLIVALCLIFAVNSHASYMPTTVEVWSIESRNGISSGQIGNWYYELVGSTDDVWYRFTVPDNFVSIIDARVMMIPDATETIQWDIDVSVAADGEAYNNDDRSADNEQLAVTASQLTGASIAGQLTGLSPGDHIGIRYQSDTVSLRVIGLEFSFVRKVGR